MTGSTLFDVRAVAAAASQETGLSDFGGDEFWDALDRLVDAVTNEARLSPIGVMSVEMDLKRWLINRLRWIHDLTEHPEIHDEDVSDPIVILGLPRTGTTKLQRMMAAMPGLRGLPLWHNLNPAPFPDSADAPIDPRILLARENTEQLLAAYPEFMALHPMLAEQPEEEVIALQLTFRSMATSWFLRVPTFFDWLVDQRQTPIYEDLRSLLQYAQWQTGGGPSRPWVLKSPLHLGRIDALLEVFPRATLVHCHRDLNLVIPSFSHLVEAARGMRSDDVDPVEIGDFMLEFWSADWERNIRQRRQLTASGQILDITYDDIRAQPTQIIRRILDARGYTPTHDDEVAMRGWETENPEHRFGRFDHSAERYGLTPERIEVAFSGYLNHFKPGRTGASV